MEKPATSKYDRHPFDPDDKSDDNASSTSLDLGNTDSPELKVAWKNRPSFNTDPKYSNDGGKQPPPTYDHDAEDFSVDFDKLGDSVNTMLTKSRSLVTQYENLRSHVLSSEGTVFGQTSMLPGSSGKYDSFSHSWGKGSDAAPTVFQKPAQEFAEQMNPAQEKALQGIGAALELFGEYIALVNHSGQVYAAADRHSLFPPPPANGVTA
ncbi:hypothetical protein [Actinoallomurus iriomotensis]|uniref:Uncharacterized protein n=1 Tax=Actinoallomurus iriomotensis TaxID=478107 RepID=A0A9W6SD56_9ACTN|nr:hypothetical protein [Actinoallomurus iriomotensis]GLY92651.1 hypothetical protein Airi02_105790 [Actinoallomurus iriomotensis]